MVFLGDYVGYGANPQWTVTRVMGLVESGALAELGNHDNAVSNSREQFNLEFDVATKLLVQIDCYSESYIACPPLLELYDGVTEEDLTKWGGSPVVESRSPCAHARREPET
jgi:hypothetical protein